ncbi:MAG TPA: phosphopantetheine-binding protein [Pseudonocardiaceae bacterium]
MTTHLTPDVRLGPLPPDLADAPPADVGSTDALPAGVGSGGVAAAGVAPREANRHELAALLDTDPARLPDRARLRADLGLDSLAMMTAVAWLEGRGVVLASEQGLPVTVGDVLSLLDRQATPGPPRGVSLVVSDGDGPAAGPGAYAPPLTAGPRRSSPLVPELADRLYRLAPVEHGDYPFLYALAAHPETGFRWRYRGAPPQPDQFGTDLWAGVLVQHLVRRIADDEPVGQVVAYAADLPNNHVHVGAVFHHRHSGTGLPARAVTLFVRYLFHTFPLHKAYLEVPGWNWPQLASGEGRLFDVEGVLREHDVYAGRRWDKYLCAIRPHHVAGPSGAGRST